MKHYAERDIIALDKAGGYYHRHVAAMTEEGLHSKADIAAELGWRDMEIERLHQDRDRNTDWYQQRFNRLRKWVNEEVKPLSEEVAHRYFAICANGAACWHESADWLNTMRALKLDVEAKRREIDRLHAALEKAVAEGGRK